MSGLLDQVFRNPFFDGFFTPEKEKVRQIDSQVSDLGTTSEESRCLEQRCRIVDMQVVSAVEGREYLRRLDRRFVSSPREGCVTRGKEAADTVRDDALADSHRLHTTIVNHKT